MQKEILGATKFHEEDVTFPLQLHQENFMLSAVTLT